MPQTLDAAEKAIADEQRRNFATAFSNVAPDPSALTPDNPLGRRRGVDEMTIRRMEKLISLEHRLQVTGVQPATILNMNPYPLRVNGVLLDDIIVPPCPKGRPYSMLVIRQHRISWRDEQDDNWTPVESVPIILAREFESTYYGQGGVVIFQGDGERTHFLNDETIQQRIKDAKVRLIAWAWKQKRDADSEWNSPNRVGARNINEIHRALVNLLLNEGEISPDDRPVWLERTRAEANLGVACQRCKADTKQDAYMCAACGFILDPRQAYELGEISEEDPALRRLSRKELDELNLSEFVQENLEERKARVAKGKAKEQKENKTKAHAKGAGQQPARRFWRSGHVTEGEQMLLNLAEVVDRTAALLDDPSKSWAEQAYLLPFINQAWDHLATRLSSLGLSQEESLVVLTPVAAGSLNLDSFAVEGGLLETMMMPTYIEWKLVGDDDILYRELPLRAMIPDVPAGVEGHVAYEFRAGHIYITASSVDTTMRVRMKVVSTNFVDPDDQVVHGLTHVLAYKAAEIVCSPTVRNNLPGMQFLAQKGTDAMDDFEVLCVKQKQRMVKRFGRTSGRGQIRRRVIVQ
jgi:hypothetical protein